MKSSAVLCAGVLLVLLAATCSSRRLPCICPRVYWPVCGTDHHTYSNECVLKCAVKRGEARADVTVLEYGECSDKLKRREKPEEFIVEKV